MSEPALSSKQKLHAVGIGYSTLAQLRKVQSIRDDYEALKDALTRAMANAGVSESRYKTNAILSIGHTEGAMNF